MRRKPIKSFVIFSTLIFLLIAPIIGTWLIINHKNKLANIHLGSAAEYRFFINPLIPIETLPVTNQAGSPFDATQLHGKWILVYFNTERCTQNQCAANLNHMAQIQKALDKDQHRLIRMWMTNDSTSKDLTVLSNKSLATLNIGKSDRLLPNHFYIVDPFGNLILSYTNNTPPQSILNDLHHLMKVSDVG